MLKPNGLPPAPTSVFRRADALALEWEEVRYRPLLSNLAVAPEYRRRGIARRLLELAEVTAREAMGFDELLLKVEQTNAPARELYRQLGYKQTDQATIVEDRFVPLAHLTNLSADLDASDAPPRAGEANFSVSAEAVPVRVTMTSRGQQVCHERDEARAPRQTGTWEATTNICLRKGLGAGMHGSASSERGARGRPRLDF